MFPTLYSLIFNEVNSFLVGLQMVYKWSTHTSDFDNHYPTFRGVKPCFQGLNYGVCSGMFTPMKTNYDVITMLERTMNELAGIWFDHLGYTRAVKRRIEIDFSKMCAGLNWKWVPGRNGKYNRIRVVTFKETTPANAVVVSLI